MTRSSPASTSALSRGRTALAICLRCVQAATPEWPFVMLWPIVKVRFANSLSQLTLRKVAQRRQLRSGPENEMATKEIR